LNVQGFYAPLKAMLDKAVDEGFLKPQHRDMILIEPAPAALLDALATWQAPRVDKWIGQPGS
jgi:predicted Rossmann-fold nucleotide-binding protein